MTLSTNGDFDQTLELSEALITAAASATLGVNSPPVDLPPGLDVTGSVSARADIDQIWFRNRPQVWEERGFGKLTRSTSDLITLGLKVGIHIDLQSVTMVVGGQVTTTDVRKDSRYDPIRSIDFTAFVEVTDHIDVQRLNVTKDREAPGVAVKVPVVVVDFNRAVGYPKEWPRVDVQINTADVQKNGALKLMMAAAELRDGAGGGDAALSGLVATLSATLTSKIREILQSMTTWQLEQDTGKALLFDTSQDDLPIRKLMVKTLAQSLFIGIDYLAPRGNIGNVTTSTLRGRGGRLDEFGVTVSNRMLLLGIIRKVLAKTFARIGTPPTPLTPADFARGEYCVLKSPVSGVAFGGGITLESLVSFVNGSSEVEIVMQFSADQAPGVTGHASLDLKLAFSVSRSVTATSQVLKLDARLANPATAVVSKSIDVAWWWYVIGLVNPVMPIVGAGLIGILDGIVLELEMSNRLFASLGSFSASLDKSIPLPVTLTAPNVELFDFNAPPMPTALGSVLANTFNAGAHDLYIGARFAKLPDPLSVEFVLPDSTDEGGRLDGIGGTLPDGSEWRLPIDDAIALIDAGHKLTVTIKPAPTVLVRVVPPLGSRQGKIPYLRTETDDFGINNLGNLPVHVPAVSSVLGPSA